MPVTKTSQVTRLMDNIKAQYPCFPATFNQCGCHRDIARGTGKCATCYEEELAALVGHDQAEYYHKKVRKLADLYIKLAGSVDDEEA